MKGGMHVDPKELPLPLREQVGVKIVAELAKTTSVARQFATEGEGSGDAVLKCDPRVFARCPYNKTCVSPEEATFTEGSDCHQFNQRVLNTPVTHFDRIRMLDDREMAAYLYTLTRACADRKCSECPIGPENCIVLLHWGRQLELG